MRTDGEAGNAENGLVTSWSFDQGRDNIAIDGAGGMNDTIEGNFKRCPGVIGTAVKFDGFSTAIIRPAADAPRLGEAFTIQAWVALGAYPWNFCPIVSQAAPGHAGYTFAVGPQGQVSLQLAVGGQWQQCASEDFAIPLRTWVHVAGVFDPQHGLAVYVNGKAAGALAAAGEPTFAADVDLRIGIPHTKLKPSNIHREHGTLAGWFTLDGLMDEIRIHDRPLPAEAIAAAAAVTPAAQPDLPPRVLPSGPEGPGRFGAYYCKLKYYDEWDALWPVGADPDVVVRFDASPVRVVFWRGSRYSPAWVSENGQWMADQSVETWRPGEGDQEGCFEHMQDRRCRYSHVRIIESSDARTVVHWRYAPVSAHDHLWNVDERTGRACWVDEYYTLYPDAMGVRKVTWKTGTVGKPRQFQESLPFTHPGQLQGDVVHADWATVGNLRGESVTLSMVANPGKEKPGVPDDLVIQMYNLKSQAKPFMIFETGNRMNYVHDRDIAALSRPGSCSHWPVGQAACDGRSSQATDRPTHFLGFPISSPPVHAEAGRSWWNGIYGMVDAPFERLAFVARSWNRPPELTLPAGGATCHGYDRGQRAYVLTRAAAAGDTPVHVELPASDDSPVFNPAFLIENWGPAGASLTLDGQPLPPGPACRIAHRHHLDRSDLIVWLQHESTAPLKITFTPA